MLPRPLTSTLFPYTTLFRSNRVYLSHSLPSAGHLFELNLAHLERDSTEADLSPGGAVHSLVWGRDVRAENVKALDRKSTRLNSSHTVISYAVFCLKKKT